MIFKSKDIEYFNINKNQYWHNNCKLHRLNGPTIIYADGDKYWYQNGKFVKRILV